MAIKTGTIVTKDKIKTFLVEGADEPSEFQHDYSNLTEQELNLLKVLVTHVDRPIYGFKYLPPEFMAGIFAMFCRTSTPMIDILLSKIRELELTPEMLEELTKGCEHLAKFNTSPSVKKLHAEFTLQGHESIRKIDAGMFIAIDACSALAEAAIRTTRRGAAFMSKSTRARKDFFTKPRYIKNLFDDNDLNTRYEALMRAAFNAAQITYDRVKEALMEKHPYDEATYKPFNVDEKKWKKMIHNRALDNARYCLPVSTITSIGFTGNALGINRMTTKLFNSPSTEFQILGGLIYDAAKDISPLLIEEPKLNHHDSRFNAASDPDIRKMRSSIEKFITNLDSEELNGMVGQPLNDKYMCRISLDEPHMNNRDFFLLMASMIIGRELAMPVDWVYGYISSEELVNNTPPEFSKFIDSSTPIVSPTDFAIRVMSKYMGLYDPKDPHHIMGRRELANMKDGVSKWSRLLRHFEFADLTYDMVLDFGAWRDLNTHQITSQWIYPLVPNLSYAVPAEFELLLPEQKDMFASLFTMSVILWKEIYEHTNIPFMAQYAGLFMWNQRRLVRMNMRQLDYITTLRTQWPGHHSYRYMSQLLFERTRDLWPDIRHILRPDMNSYSFGNVLVKGDKNNEDT